MNTSFYGLVNRLTASASTVRTSFSRCWCLPASDSFHSAGSTGYRQVGHPGDHRQRTSRCSLSEATRSRFGITGWRDPSQRPNGFWRGVVARRPRVRTCGVWRVRSTSSGVKRFAVSDSVGPETRHSCSPHTPHSTGHPV